MFKLTVAFADIAALSAFVNKMGGSVMGGTIEHAQPISESAAMNAPQEQPAKAAPRSRAKKPAVVEAPAASQTVDLAPNMMGAPTGGSPFGMGMPGTPANFAPGNTATQPMAQPANFQNVAPIQQAAPTIAAPVMQAPAAPVPVSPMRQKYNEECAKLVTFMQSTGRSDGELGQVMANSFLEAGCAMGSRISTISDAEMERFYPVLHRNASALAN